MIEASACMLTTPKIIEETHWNSSMSQSIAQIGHKDLFLAMKMEGAETCKIAQNAMAGRNLSSILNILKPDHAQMESNAQRKIAHFSIQCKRRGIRRIWMISISKN